MTNTIPNGLQGFDLGGVFIYQDANSEEHGYFYIPGSPQPQLDQNDKPDVEIEVSNDGANVRMKTRWAADEAEREQLISGIASHENIPADQISLSVGTFNQPQVHLIIGDGSKTVQDLGPIQASATSPLQANVQETLTATEKGDALPAFNGDSGHLMVTYNGVLEVSAHIKARIHGDLAEDIKALVPEKKKKKHGWHWGSDNTDSEEQKVTVEQCREQIEKSLEAGRLTLSHDNSPNVPEELRQEVDGIVTDKVVEILFQKVSEAIAQDVVPNKSKVDTSHEETQSKTYPIERTADVGNWFKNINGTTHIKQAPGPIPSPDRKDHPDPPNNGGGGGGGGSTPTGTVVRLSFTPEDLHDFNNDSIVEAIDVTSGDQTQTLQAPDFAPITWPSTAIGQVTLETHFKSSRSFTHEVPVSGSELALTSDMLGVIQIEVNGSAFKAARARQATIQVAYLPTSHGVRERRTIHFHDNDEEWVKRWFAITRSTDLGGSIQWSWTVKLHSGHSEKQGQTKVETPHLVLQPTQ